MIRIEHLSFGYRKAPLYHDFNLCLSEPGVYGLFGRNGSGKSTLLLLLAGLLFPKGGRIDVQGHEPARRHPDFLRQVYIVPEEFHLPNLRPDKLAQTQSGFYPDFSSASFAEYLGIFEVPAGSCFEEMSLGQKKKAAIAFALATFTPVLLLDEPTNGLDIISRDQFKAIMARPEQRRRIVLISTHQAHDLERIMSHILFIDGASLALSATMAELGSALSIGVAADAAALAAIPDILYSEALGTQQAYVAVNHGAVAGEVHLELLYKALSLRKDAVLAVLAAKEKARV
ncbi:MAG TPA: ATP-binding cassette domain-containing protein [Xanthomonadaceae bacterium]|nr:ATP-binding cassette domain-containing protein [Xanthomonadaceae bacterium]